MKNIVHGWPWLIDALADTCRGWLSEDELPPILRDWKRTDTTIPPCTFRGVDFEMLSLREEAKANQARPPSRPTH